MVEVVIVVVVVVVVISRKWTHHVTTLLFLGFGLWSLWDVVKGEGEAEELAEVEAKLDADWKANKGSTKQGKKANDDLKKERRQFLTQFFSPIFLKAFSITFFGEWGDKSQIATIGLAADENPLGVVLGGILGQALCTTAAVLGGKSLASQISEKFVALSGGVLFIIFGIQSFLATVECKVVHIQSVTSLDLEQHKHDSFLSQLVAAEIVVEFVGVGASVEAVVVVVVIIVIQGNKLCSSTLLSTLLYDLFLNSFSSDSSLRSATVTDLRAARIRDPACLSFSNGVL
ncbi:hypothetical protein TEA_010250 [Camellia sinensis var. sinensis]|uniref:GDT1 family protein n=1 Tax=Camellia sinensis var. sinensis TaxID=542762 RepID=A0A4S4DWL7_CAMSN|nr:hypothetical protein TEA_010250 [Camellia sinensis var. sinensis]